MPNTTPVKFKYASNMQVGRRFMLMAGLMIGGFVVQYTYSSVLGWVLFLWGCLLGIIRGGTNEPKLSNATVDWQNTTIEELQSIENLSSQIGKWRGKANPFSMGTGKGCGTFLLAILGLGAGAIYIGTAVDGAASWFIPPIRGGALLPVWVLDGFAVMIPVWFAGRLTAWEPSELARKAHYLIGIYEAYKSQPTLEFLPSLQVATENDKSVPHDCRMLVRIKDAPEDFIGIQIQVSLNSVQGTSYPYSYCVLIAKKSFGLKVKAIPYLESPPGKGLLGGLFKDANTKREAEFCRFSGSIAETTSADDTDVVVIRQVTVGSGYTTSEKQAQEVFANALDLAWKVLWPKK